MIRTTDVAPMVLIALAGCAIPGRDNEFDPNNAPVARLQVLDVGDAEDPCPPTVITGDANLFVPIGHCIALDAGASEDPQDTLDYRFEARHSAGVMALGSGASPVRVLLRDERALLPAGEVVFKVYVTGGDRTVEAERAISFLNERPVAAVGADRVLEQGGFPWAEDQPYAVFFDATRSVDPDGMQPTYCWSFPPEAPAAAACDLQPEADGLCDDDATNPCFTRSIDSTIRARTVATLLVRDPQGGRSTPAQQTVAIADRPLYAGSQLSVRMDDRAGRAPILGGPSPMFQLLFLERPDPVGVFLSGNTVIIRGLTWPDGSPTSGPAVPVGFRHDLIASGPDRVWLATRTATAGSFTAYDVDANGDVTAAGISASLPADWAYDDAAGGNGSGRRASLLAFDGARVWSAPFARQRLAAVEASPTLAFDLTTTGSITGMGVRPGTAELWTIETDPLGPVHAVVRIDGVVTNDVDLGVSYAAGLAWESSEVLWLLTTERGLLRLDAGALVAPSSSPLDLATLLSVPELSDPLGIDRLSGARLVVDSGGSRCWFTKFASRDTVRIDRDGTVAVHKKPGDITVFTPPLYAVDREGTIWYHVSGPGDGELRRGLGVDENGIFERFDSTKSPNTDLGTGWIWFFRELPRTIEAVTEDGFRVRTISAVDHGGVIREVPVLASLRLAPNGASAWAMVTSGPDEGLWWFDLSTTDDTPIARHVPVGDVEFGQVLEPLSPSGGSAWFGFDLGTELAIVSSSGTMTTVVSGSTNYGLVGRALVSNRICATRANGGTELVWIDLDGGITPLVTSTAGLAFRITVGSDPTGETCWISAVDFATESSTLRGYTVPGAPLHTLTFPNIFLASGTSRGSHEIFVAPAPFLGGNAFVVRLEFDELGPLVSNETISAPSDPIDAAAAYTLFGPE